jgi:hypothetical protein
MLGFRFVGTRRVVVCVGAFRPVTREVNYDDG